MLQHQLAALSGNHSAPPLSKKLPKGFQHFYNVKLDCCLGKETMHQVMLVRLDMQISEILKYCDCKLRVL